MPGYRASKVADKPPRKRPSAAAYSGAVLGAAVFLKTVMRARMRPAMAPKIISGAAAPAPPCMALDQVKDAPAMTRARRMPVLLTVPWTVMVPVLLLVWADVKVLAFKAGLAVRIMVVLIGLASRFLFTIPLNQSEREGSSLYNL